ncbi:MAG: four-carbon acid sugar kinase family protein [Desulfobacterales bacterium]|jgi:uncharacterized protein YgbK (DUF1537 family)
MNPIVIIADDLTGAADTGVQFCPFYDDTILLSYLQLADAVAPTPGSALALYTNSRALEMMAAQKRLRSVARGLSELKPFQIYKKMDSCLRGNPGTETEALMDELEYEASFIAPAFPEMGRTTVNGNHLVHGIPVGQTEISRDPITPVTESDLCRLIQRQCRYPVGHIALNLMEGDETALVDEIERQIRQGIRHIVFDATCREHLDRVARLIDSCSYIILPVGSAGLAAGLGGLLSARSILKNHGPRPSETGHCLLVCGTKSEVTRRQIETLMAMYPYEEISLDPGILIDEKERDAVLNNASLVRSKLSVNHVIVTIDYSRPLVVSGRHLSQKQTAQSLLAGLERFLAQALRETRPGLLFLTGGDTADAAITAAAAKGIRIFGEITTGVVRGTLIGGILDGVPVVTKAGAFGGEDTLVVLHKTVIEKG